jgi:hypothetical protein
MIYNIFAPRKKAYRMPPAGYRAPAYRATSKAIPVVMNSELKDMQHARKQKRGNQ